MRTQRASCASYGSNYPTMKIIRIINILACAWALPRGVKFSDMRTQRASCASYRSNYPTMKIIRIINILPILS
jgi:hypothetical protein